MRVRSRGSVRFVAFLTVLVGLGSWFAPGAAAKFGVLLSLSSSKPQVGQAVQVVIRTGPTGSGV